MECLPELRDLLTGPSPVSLDETEITGDLYDSIVYE